MRTLRQPPSLLVTPRNGSTSLAPLPKRLGWDEPCGHGVARENAGRPRSGSLEGWQPTTLTNSTSTTPRSGFSARLSSNPISWPLLARRPNRTTWGARCRPALRRAASTVAGYCTAPATTPPSRSTNRSRSLSSMSKRTRWRSTAPPNVQDRPVLRSRAANDQRRVPTATEPHAANRRVGAHHHR